MRVVPVTWDHVPVEMGNLVAERGEVDFVGV